MSNKALLAYVLSVVLVIGAGIFIWWRWGENHKTVSQVSQNQIQQETELQETVQNNPSPSTQTMPESNQCQRNFDENVLKSAQVDIKNRQVEINVKDFGKMTVELYDKDAPKTVENFLRLANSGYFNCVTFHRVAKGFVIQGGDPTGTGGGGDSAFGGVFADELDSNTSSYKAGYQKGVLAMANRGPNTNTSQFFILLDDATSWMPHNYTIFGKVVLGQDTVDKISQVEIIPNYDLNPNGTDGAPKTPVVMESVKIIK